MKNTRSISLKVAVSCWCLGIFALIFADQATKYLAVQKLKGTAGITLIPRILELQYIENRGMAFGMLQGRRMLFLVICVVFFAILGWMVIRIPKTSYYLPLMVTGGVLAAGAAGNFIDRIYQGFVIDFIYVSLIDFPVFNVADIYVVCGGIVFVILMLFRYKDEDFYFLNAKNAKG